MRGTTAAVLDRIGGQKIVVSGRPFMGWERLERFGNRRIENGNFDLRIKERKRPLRLFSPRER